MESTDELKREFQQIFGTPGGAVSLGNVGQSRRIVDLIREIMNRTEPLRLLRRLGLEAARYGSA